MRKLPQTGDAVAYTRDFIANVPDRARWRGIIIARCSFYTDAWPMLRVRWNADRGSHGNRMDLIHENDVNAHNLRKLRLR